MNQQTINKLNQLNHYFYQETASDFSSTRQQAWKGWSQLSELLKRRLTKLTDSQTILAVLDVGCGNGRFGEFLKQEFPQASLDYYGLDASSKLLQLAQVNLSQSYQNDSLHLIEVDIMSYFEPIKADLICLFGVMHHIPSFTKRQQLLQKLVDQLNPGGYLVFTAWQFDRLPNLMSRQLKPADIGVDPAELEAHDYLLTWERGASAIRYCHLLKEPELQLLVKSTGLSQLTTYTADGADNQLNQYVILQRVV